MMVWLFAIVVVIDLSLLTPKLLKLLGSLLLLWIVFLAVRLYFRRVLSPFRRLFICLSVPSVISLWWKKGALRVLARKIHKLLWVLSS